MSARFSSQKRRRVEDDGPQSQRRRAYTDSERFILQQAASILNVNFHDLPFRRDASPVASNFVGQNNLLARSNGLDPLRIPISIDGSQTASSLEATETSLTSLLTNDSWPKDLGKSQSQYTPNNTAQPKLKVGAVPSGPTSLWTGYGESNEMGQPQVDYNPSGSQTTQLDVNTELVPPFLQANYGAANGFHSSVPLDAFPPSSNTELASTWPIAPQTTYRGAVILDEPNFPQTLIESLPTSSIDSLPMPPESGYSAVNILHESNPSLATPDNPAAHPTLGQVNPNPGLPFDQQYRPELQFQFDNFGSFGNVTYDVSQCTKNSAWRFSLPNSLASTSQAQPAVVQGLASQSQLQQLELEPSTAQDFSLEPFVHRTYYPDSLDTTNFGERPPHWMPNEMSFPDLLASHMEPPIDEWQLALRGPSHNSISAMTSQTTHNRRQEPVSEALTAGQEDLSLLEPNSLNLFSGPAGNEMVIFTSPLASRRYGGQGPRVRQPFQDRAKRMQTSETRKTGACVRCRMQRIRCSPAEEDEDGPCATCAKISGPTLCKLPCVRYKITDSSLFDKGQHPQFRWSQRWSSWDLVEIDTWASSEIKTITVTQDVLGGSTFRIRCREFVPMEGDSLARTWKKNGTTVYYQRAPYAILSMKETGNEMKRFVANNIGASIKYYIMQRQDRLLSSTYAMAYAMVFRPRDFAENEEGKRLLQEVFQLWVAIRMESQSERIVGDETLGMEPQTFDRDVSSYGTNSIPPIMSAQVELITTTRILQPLKKAVLKRLQRLIQANDLRSWFPIYLCLFVLLHSCSILTADENRQARKYGLKTRYVYDAFIEELHMGAKTMIYYFHYCNKGNHPFAREWMSEENLALAGLNEEQGQFLKESMVLINERLPEFERIRESQDFENDWYFVSQLYDAEWRPRSTI